jgi:excinuclease ABC subunit C
MFNIQDELAKLPLKPGVYIMKDETENIIYIGKAIKLKNRVRQYFRESTNHSPKIQRMVSMVSSFEYIVTDSELEALILECNLIKKHRPKYNTLLKDDKTFPYIKVTVQEAFPRVYLTRIVKKDKAKYFGPYSSAYMAKETIDIIKNIWHIRSCNRNLPKDIGKERPCLFYHIKQCEAPCYGYITKEEYHKKTEEILEFLGGKSEKLTKMLQSEMLQASEALDFEKAAKLRDQLTAVLSISQKQKIANASMEDKDVIAFASREDEALVQVFFIRNGKMIGREHFHVNGVEGASRSSVMNDFIKQYYSGTPYIPKELILQEDIEEANIISNWLSDKRGHKVYIKVPRKGEKNKLVELAARNAELTLEQFGEQIKQKEKKTKGALEELISLTGLESDIKRIEAYDISNTSGVQSVGSMIVFEEGIPKRSDYRKFKIKSVDGPNDYASLEEVLTRRLTHGLQEQKELIEKNMDARFGKFSKLPDLILMDGGKGQVNIALKVLENIGLCIPVCGMVKDDNHRTRGLFLDNQEIIINKHSESFKLITRIQDEAHRFAIEYHRKLRGNEQIKSILDDIEGIGPKRKKALMKHFGSIEKIKMASVEELLLVEGMNRPSATKLRAHFNEN